MRFTLLTLLVFSSSVLLAQLSIPEHGGVWIHDEAHVLSAGMKRQIESILKAERDSTSNQIAILIIQSLEGELPEEYSLRVAEKWKLGKKDTDNGVLWLISINDRLMRIEVGHGLEGTLTDALSSRINRNEVAPNFRRGDYDAGVYAGTMAIIHAIQGQYVNTDPAPRGRKARSPWTTLIFIVLIIILASRRRRGGGGGMGMLVLGSMLGSGLGRGGSGGDYGGGGSFGGGGSSDSW